MNERDFVETLTKMYNLSKKERKALGEKGRQHVMKNYNFDNFQQKWVDYMLQVHKEEGSWDTRKQIQHWTLEELK